MHAGDGTGPTSCEGYLCICPVCSCPLLRQATTYRCTSGHAFDVAREGYVNLLRTRSTGDSAEMLRARRAFLARGHYAPLADAVVEIVGAHPAGRREHPGRMGSPGQPAAVLDSGCGEGYYLGRLQTRLAPPVAGENCRLWGLDSSRDAVRMAARRYRDAGFVVADCKDMVPFAAGSLVAVLSIFAPRNPAEFARVLASGGLWLIAAPSPSHLGELREELDFLGMEQDKLQHILDSLDGLFGEPEIRTLAYAMDLGGEDVALLATMTPSHRHRPEQRLAAIRQREHYRVTASFTLVACRRV